MIAAPARGDRHATRISVAPYGGCDLFIRRDPTARAVGYTLPPPTAAHCLLPTAYRLLFLARDERAHGVAPRPFFAARAVDPAGDVVGGLTGVRIRVLDEQGRTGIRVHVLELARPRGRRRADVRLKLAAR